MTFEIPTLRESGMGKDVEIVLEDKIIVSVLSSYSFSFLLDIHNLTSWMHFCMDYKRQLTGCGVVADFLNCVSSVKEW